jgi:GNAT superfamily N-acetyltransferase
MEIQIRQFKSSDKKDISSIIRENFLTVNIKDYSKEEMTKYTDHFSEEKVLELSKTRDILVAVNQEKIIGTASIGLFGPPEDNNWTVFTVFIKTTHHSSGIGRKLMYEIEKLAKIKSIKKLTVPSSITALNFYKKIGYILKLKYFSVLCNLTTSKLFRCNISN